MGVWVDLLEVGLGFLIESDRDFWLKSVVEREKSIAIIKVDQLIKSDLDLKNGRRLDLDKSLNRQNLKKHLDLDLKKAPNPQFTHHTLLFLLTIRILNFISLLKNPLNPLITVDTMVIVTLDNKL